MNNIITKLNKLSNAINNSHISNKIKQIIFKISSDEIPPEDIDWEQELGQKRLGTPEESEWFHTRKENSESKKDWFSLINSMKETENIEDLKQKIEESGLFPSIESAPEGDYRIVLFPLSSKNFVLKLAKDSSGARMNKEDFDLAKAFPNIMALCYEHHPEFLWVIMDKIKVVGRSDKELLQKILNKSFSSESKAFLDYMKKLEDIVKNIPNYNSPEARPGAKEWANVRSKFKQLSEKINEEFNQGLEEDDWEFPVSPQKLAQFVQSDEFKNYKDPMNVFRAIKQAIQIQRSEDGDLEGIKEIWGQEIRKMAGPTFNELARAVSTFGISIKDIRPLNIGCDNKYNFKLLDSSIESTMIEAG